MIDDTVIEDTQHELESTETNEVDSGSTNTPEVTAKQSEGNSERNFRELRKKAERAEQEREMYRQRVAQLEAAQKPEATDAEPDDISLGDDDIMEGRHAKQMAKKYKKLEAEVQSLRQKTAEDITETRIRSRFPDYYEVVNEDTLRALTIDDPELAYTIQSSPDFYNKAILAYKEIKKRGLSEESTYVRDSRLIQSNASKPRPIVSASPQQGSSPLTHANMFANGLTKELAAYLNKEMEECKRNA